MPIKDSILSILISIYILILPLTPEKFKLRGFSVNTDMFLAAIILVYIVKFLIYSETRKRFIYGFKDFFTNKLSLFMLLLFIVMLISTLYSTDKHIALNESARFLSYLILFFIIKFEVKGNKYQKLILLAYLCTLIVISLTGIIGFITGHGIQIVYSERRAEGTLGNSNSLGAFLILGLFPLIMLFLSSKKKVFYAICTIICISGIIVSGSRSAYLALILGIIFICVLYNKKLIFIFVPLGAVFLLIPTVFKRIVDIFSSSQNSSRILLWKTALKMIKDHPILGVGNGNFTVLYDSYVKKYPYLYHWGFTKWPVHNSYLKILSELGIMGIISFILILIYAFIYVRKMLIRERDNFIVSFYRGFTISVVIFYFMNFLDNLFFVPKVTTFFWLLLGISQGVLLKFETKKELNEG